MRNVFYNTKKVYFLVFLLGALFPTRVAAQGEKNTTKEVVSFVRRVTNFLVQKGKGGSYLISFIVFLCLLLGFVGGYKVGFVWQLVATAGFHVFFGFHKTLKGPVDTVLAKVGFVSGSHLLGAVSTLVLLLGFFVTLLVVHRVVTSVLGFLFLGFLEKMAGGALGLFVGSATTGCVLVVAKEVLGVDVFKDLIISIAQFEAIVEKIFGAGCLNRCKEIGRFIAEQQTLL